MYRSFHFSSRPTLSTAIYDSELLLQDTNSSHSLWFIVFKEHLLYASSVYVFWNDFEGKRNINVNWTQEVTCSEREDRSINNYTREASGERGSPEIELRIKANRFQSRT